MNPVAAGLVGAKLLFALGAIAVVVLMVSGSNSTDERSTPSPARQARAASALADHGVIFRPVAPGEASGREIAPAPRPGTIASFSGDQVGSADSSRVYFGRLREVRSPDLGPHGGWSVVGVSGSPVGPGQQRDRFAYVSELHGLAPCAVELTCLQPDGSNPSRLDVYYSFVDGLTGKPLGGLGLP